jgi:hypothetical protein
VNPTESLSNFYPSQLFSFQVACLCSLGALLGPEEL